jgi:hypothetical protein
VWLVQIWSCYYKGSGVLSLLAVEQSVEPAVGGGEDHLEDQKNRQGGYEEREKERKEREETADGGVGGSTELFFQNNQTVSLTPTDTAYSLSKVY